MLDPNQRLQGSLLISSDGVYAYRLYRLARHWNKFLSGRAADSVTALFSGEVVTEPSPACPACAGQADSPSRIADYSPALEVEATLARLLVGMVAAGGLIPDGTVNAPTAHNLRAALGRLQHVDLEPMYVRRGLADNNSEI